MTFKRLAVRSRLSPPKTINHKAKNLVVFSYLKLIINGQLMIQKRKYKESILHRIKKTFLIIWEIAHRRIVSENRGEKQ